jgi:hypothetical protein
LPDSIDPDALAGGWTHSHEEDQGGLQVFRRPSHPFPRSRGRTSYELRPGGALGGSAPGPDDRHVATSGSWRLQGDRLTVAPEGASPQTFEVQSLEPDRLVVKPVITPN